MSSYAAPVLPTMPDFSSPNHSFPATGDMKLYFHNALQRKAEQLQLAGNFGQRVLTQQSELEERIRRIEELEVNKGDVDEIDEEARQRYQELADTIVAWEEENLQLSGQFGNNSKDLLNVGLHSPAAPYTDLSRDEPERSKPTAGTSAAQSRRAKNAAHRADDVEFAFEIGSGLLTEVRRLQSLLGERDKAIQDMKEEKDDLEKTVEGLKTLLKQQEQNTDKFKEENWNLEVRQQELISRLEDQTATIQRLESDNKRITKALAQSRDTAEQQKTEAERLNNVVEQLKVKHDTDIAHARKHAAGLTRDKSDLQQALDTLKADVARAGRKLPRYSPLTPGGGDVKDFLTPAGHDDGEDVFGTTGRGSTNRRNLDVAALFPPDEFGSDFPDSPEPSPLRRPFLAPNHPTNEIEALQQRLAHAQRQINTLKGTLTREKQLRIKLEAEAQQAQAAPEEHVDEDADESTTDKKSVRRVTPFKVGANRSARGRGRGRGRGGITLMQRLGMAAGSPSSDYHDDDDDDRHNLSDGSPPPPVPSIPKNFSQHEDDDEVSQFFGDRIDAAQDDQEEQRSRSPSPSPAAPEAEPRSNRTSVDGMDPAFANVLRRTPSNGSYTGSPLRQAVLGRSARGGGVGRRKRGGVPFKEARPPSIVDAPEVLAAELSGFESSPLKSLSTSLLNGDVIEEDDDGVEYIRVKKVEKVEFGCQTENFEDEKTVILSEPPVLPEPEPVPAPPSVVHVEMGVQSDPEPEPVLAPVVPPPPPVVHAEMGIQSEPEPEPVLPPKPTMAEISLQTDPEPTPVMVEKAELGVQFNAPEPAPPVLVDSGIGTDPIPEPLAQPQAPLGRGLPPLATSNGDRRTTITQSDVSRSSSGTADTTITRSFLGVRPLIDEDELDEGEETETGAETEDDYHDARQSIVLTTPTEDYHSVRTMSDNDYSDSEDDAESIKASHFSSRHQRSTQSLDRPPTSASSYYAPVPERTPSYETVGVSADLFEIPEPVVIQAPKPEVKEVSIQTEDWKPSTPPAPIPAVLTPSPSPKPALYRVGSSNSHQFQFIPPPSSGSSNALSASAPAPVFTAPSPISTPMSSVFRESASSTFGRRTGSSDRRQSIESLIASGHKGEDSAIRARVPSTSANGPLLTSMDKSRPPVMSLPPPPKLPPPPNSMPPPNFIPDRRVNGQRDVPPPRPSSPPPAELIQRATTPLGSVLSVPGNNQHSYSIRSLSASVPPSHGGLRQPPSTGSFRSGSHTPGHAYVPSGTLSSHSVREHTHHGRSTTSLTSDHSMASPRSSMSSDRHQFDRSTGPGAVTEAPSTPNKSADITPRAHNVMSTDPAIIHAITQTMIGEFLYKYTRRAIGKGVGEKRHKRFFWVHPYTKTLYWSSADPGSSNVSESSAKSAYIEGVRSVLDPNPMPPGLYQYSVIVSTPQREMKITALTKERHDIWLNALKYLLSRPNNPSIMSPANNSILPQTPENTNRRPPMTTSPQSQRSARSAVAGDVWNTTPRGQRSRSQLSVGRSGSKRSGTPALEYLRYGPESPYSPDRSFVDVPDPEDLDFELHGDNASDDEGFEGLENVRACCDGRHTVGHAHHHHHHHPSGPASQDYHNQGTVTTRRSVETRHLEPHAPENARPASPAWSFRSRTGSAQSHEGGLFGWARREDGKSRFGSRRSTKTSVPTVD